MANSIYITATEPHSGKIAVVLGMMQTMLRHTQKVAFFRPIVDVAKGKDSDTALVLSYFNLDMDPEDTYACTFKDARELINTQKHGQLLELILHKFRQLSEKYDFIVVEGTEFTGGSASFEAELNLEIASVLDSPLGLVCSGTERAADEICAITQGSLELLFERQQEIGALFINRARLSDVEAKGIAACIGSNAPSLPIFVLQENNILARPSLADVQRSLQAEVLYGVEYLDTLVDDYRTAAMQVGNFLDYIDDGVLVVTPGDRSDIVLAALASRVSKTCPNISGVLLTGGLKVSQNVLKLAAGLEGSPTPILSVPGHTYTVIMALASLYASIKPGDTRKIETALQVFEKGVAADTLAQTLLTRESKRVTPLMFEMQLNARAQKHTMRIVLPEGEEERILQAAEIIARRAVAKIILLGRRDIIQRTAFRMGLKLEGVDIIEPEQAKNFEDYAKTYAELRQKKGVTLEQAREKMRDPNYYATMMVYKDDADGMVSGSINTTANTIRPAFEFIKTRPEVSNVSSVFLMCMPDRVLVFGDCAVIPNPTADQLADIAISSAHTAETFGIEPRIALLSYSTGTSGKGADVDVVIEATNTAKERAPELLLEGPIQYDAAVDFDVARTKLPDSKVAGQATVFVFPDLNTGNNTYKAVQRSAGVTAIGPILQGLNKPVNDLSRGCLVPDIVNTVTITAIQAQAIKGLV